MFHGLVARPRISKAHRAINNKINKQKERQMIAHLPPRSGRLLPSREIAVNYLA
ncbi:hypothetical protein ACQR1I_10680 [Bradyrhizobium sp. HKCCYLS2038]|uniref:hypothetical protein n=1 Tax=unclassified Bradyrhizobium TaxID=2631580 RepID=UPI003EBEFE6E